MSLILFSLQTWSLTSDEINKFSEQKFQMSREACLGKKYLQTCYQVSKEVCEKEFLVSYSGCLKMAQDRMKNDKKILLSEWRNKIDACITRDLGLKWKAQLNPDKSCALPPKKEL